MPKHPPKNDAAIDVALQFKRQDGVVTVALRCDWCGVLSDVDDANLFHILEEVMDGSNKMRLRCVDRDGCRDRAGARWAVRQSGKIR